MSRTGSAILPVILCGGSGTRLWPMSRGSTPKPFNDLTGDGSTFQMAVQRVTAPGIFRRPIVIASQEARIVVADQLAQIGVEADLIIEPVQRDSAAAIAVAACYAASSSPDGIVLVVPADHLINDQAAFVAACQVAGGLARQGRIMALGVRPRYPATGYGYIQTGSPLAGGDGSTIVRFIEKPDAATAQVLMDQGFVWNTGNFLFRSDVMLAELERFQPEILAAAREALKDAETELGALCLGRSFERTPRISIDIAVMERTERAGVLPVSFAWADIGTWSALWDASPRDEAGNAKRGQVATVETHNSLIHGEGILAAVAGLDDVVVVAKPDAVLVASRLRSDLVKDLVEALHQQNRPEASDHLRVHRSWGWYQRTDQGPRFQVKRITVKPGGCLSLQKHHHCSEHWVVVSGIAAVTLNDREALVHENEAIYIPIGAAHRLANPGRIPLEVIEIQIGNYLGEDVNIRIADPDGP